MISMFYDPMIAKLIASAPTRAEAIDSLRLALDHYQIAGVATNRQFLSAILDDADFRAGNITTGFIAEKYGDAFAPFVAAGTKAEKLMALALPFTPAPRPVCKKKAMQIKNLSCCAAVAMRQRCRLWPAGARDRGRPGHHQQKQLSFNRYAGSAPASFRHFV